MYFTRHSVQFQQKFIDLFLNELCYAIKFCHIEDQVRSKISPDNTEYTQ